MPSLALTPRGHLLLSQTDDAPELPVDLSRTLEGAFARGSGHGLLELGAGEVGTALPADFSYWRDFAARLVTVICTHPDLDAHDAPIPAPPLGELEALAAAALEQACFTRGLLVLTCGVRSVRMAPPLVVTRGQADVALAIVTDALASLAGDHQ